MSDAGGKVVTDPRADVVTRCATDDHDLVLAIERLAWTPMERLECLIDMVAFEELAHRARRPGESR